MIPYFFFVLQIQIAEIIRRLKILFLMRNSSYNLQLFICFSLISLNSLFSLNSFNFNLKSSHLTVDDIQQDLEVVMKMMFCRRLKT